MYCTEYPSRLQNAPDLPTFRASSSREALLETALDRLNGARNTDAEAGGLLIQLLFHSLRNRGKDSIQPVQTTQIQLFSSILERLEKRLIRMDNSSTLAQEPLHGLLLALKLVHCHSARIVNRYLVQPNNI